MINGAYHSKSSTYHSVSNRRAEVGIKQMKRLLHNYDSPNVSHNTDKFLRACRGLIWSSTQGCTSCIKGETVYVQKVMPLWKEAWSLKEKALRKRAIKTVESLVEHSKTLPPLRHGDKVFILNQLL